MKITILAENKVYEEYLLAEHGLSLLIEVGGDGKSPNNDTPQGNSLQNDPPQYDSFQGKSPNNDTPQGHSSQGASLQDSSPQGSSLNDSPLTILFDAGQSSKTIDNAKLLGVDLKTVDFAMLSHGHFDHCGGFPEFRRMNSAAKLYIHKDAICSSYAVEADGALEDFDCGVDWIGETDKIQFDCRYDKNNLNGDKVYNDKDCNDNDSKDKCRLIRESVPSNISFTDGPLWINDDIVISGTIPKKYRQAHTEEFARIVDGEVVIDEMDHEQFLGIRENGKVTLISGCSHNGPEAVINYGKEIFGCDEIETLIGGMHMGALSIEQCEPIVDSLLKTGVKRVIPLHCTGMNAIFEFKRRLGDNCTFMNVGDKVKI